MPPNEETKPAKGTSMGYRMKNTNERTLEWYKSCDKTHVITVNWPIFHIWKNGHTWEIIRIGSPFQKQRRYLIFCSYLTTFSTVFYGEYSTILATFHHFERSFISQFILRAKRNTSNGNLWEFIDEIQRRCCSLFFSYSSHGFHEHQEMSSLWERQTFIRRWIRKIFGS